ncbi:hypothetical protein A0H81_02461 [Grifola frondosa]|uniref:Uncharacterized protein n=1 Tax=Grifola frondosa TaxID=5627 RepID=A0A1C7MNH7_GRIFR|nr:hypothetical protein A0H81_02461 [Grifola frondosa]
MYLVFKAKYATFSSPTSSRPFLLHEIKRTVRVSNIHKPHLTYIIQRLSNERLLAARQSETATYYYHTNSRAAAHSLALRPHLRPLSHVHARLSLPGMDPDEAGTLKRVPRVREEPEYGVAGLRDAGVRVEYVSAGETDPSSSSDASSLCGRRRCWEY